MISNLRAVATAAGLAGLLLAGPAIAACGSSGGTGSGGTGSGGTTPAASASTPTATPAPDGSTVSTAMKTAANKATSVHITGTVAETGSTVGMNMTLTADGSLYGSVTESGKSFTLLVTGGTPYIKITKSFLAAGGLSAAKCSSVCGKYLKEPASQASSLTKDLSLHSLVKQALDSPSTDMSALSFTPVTYAGGPAFQASGPNGARIVVGPAPAYLPLLITSGSKVTVTFSDWNTATVPGPPPASKVLTDQQLGQELAG